MENNFNNGEIKENKNNSKLIIIVLTILLVGALGFICYDKFINTEKPPVPTPTSSPNSGEYDAWMSYLLEQNITKITYQKGDVSDSDNLARYPLVNVTTDQLKAFFKDFKSRNLKLSKENWLGRGDASNMLTIKYLKNGVEYEIKLEDGTLLWDSEDNDFISKVESIGYTKVGFEEAVSSIYYSFYDPDCDSRFNDSCGYVFDLDSYFK